MTIEIEITQEQITLFCSGKEGKKLATAQVLGVHNAANYRKLYNYLNYRGYITNKRAKSKIKIVT